MNLDEDHKDDQRAGALLLQTQADREGVVQCGGEKAPEDLKGTFQCIKRAGERIFVRPCSNRTKGNGFKLKQSRFRLGIRNSLF